MSKPIARSRGACILALALTLLVAAPALAAAATASSDNIHGLWLLEGGKIAVEIGPCGEAVCGKIAWVATDMPERDVENRDATLRERALMGLEILTGLRPADAGETRFEGGAFYDPTEGRTLYRCRVELQKDGSLKLRGYPDLRRNGRMVRSRFGRTLRLTRVNPEELAR